MPQADVPSPAMPRRRRRNRIERWNWRHLPGFHPKTHWQVNAALVALALDWLQPKATSALDLFSGIGNFPCRWRSASDRLKPWKVMPA